MTERPGFMLYFEVLPALDILNDEEAGRLFRALIAYGQYGEVRDLSGSEAVAFQMLRGRMDRDAEAYREKCRKNTYNAYVRLSKQRGAQPVEYEDWERTIVDDRQPTTNATPNTTGISNPERKPSGAGASTELSTGFSTEGAQKEEADTAWVLPYLEEWKQNRQRSVTG